MLISQHSLIFFKGIIMEIVFAIIACIPVGIILMIIGDRSLKYDSLFYVGKIMSIFGIIGTGLMVIVGLVYDFWRAVNGG